MKKLVVLALVLGIASFATAGLVNDAIVATVNGEAWDGSDLEPSDIVTISVVTNATAFGGYSGVNAIVTDAELVDFTFVTAGLAASSYTAVQEGMNIRITGGSTGFPHPAGEIFAVTFHVPQLPDSGMIIFDFLAGAYNGPLATEGQDEWGYAALHVTPEPMSMALLGLGGLFLRRRK